MPSLKFGFTVQKIIDEGRVSEKNIATVKEWLKTQNLPKITEEQMVIFLSSRNNEEIAAKNAIHAHYKIKSLIPEVFKNRNLEREDLQKNLKAAQLAVLPARTEEGCAIVLSRVVDGNYKNSEMGPHFLNIFAAIDATVYDHPPTGLILVFDVGLVTLMHFTCIKLGLLKHVIHYLEEGLPVKLNKIHLMNCSSVIDKVLKMIKPITKKELLDKIQCHTSKVDMEFFYANCLPKRCLPQEYGGELPPMADLHESHLQNITNMKSYFDAEEEQRL